MDPAAAVEEKPAPVDSIRVDTPARAETARLEDDVPPMPKVDEGVMGRSSATRKISRRSSLPPRTSARDAPVVCVKGGDVCVGVKGERYG
jgi:hypothetical protein